MHLLFIKMSRVELQSQSPEEDYFKDLKAVTTETL